MSSLEKGQLDSAPRRKRASWEWLIWLLVAIQVTYSINLFFPGIFPDITHFAYYQDLSAFWNKIEPAVNFLATTFFKLLAVFWFAWTFKNGSGIQASLIAIMVASQLSLDTMKSCRVGAEDKSWLGSWGCGNEVMQNIVVVGAVIVVWSRG